MKPVKRSNVATLFCCAAAAFAVAAFSPHSASAADAGTAANAKILNVVTVTYYDATGNNQHQAATSTSIIVQLKPAPLTVATQVAFQPVDSGATATTYVALTSNANGSDTYKVNFSNAASNLSLSPHTITASITTNPSGANPTSISDGGTFPLGATSIVSVDAASSGTQKIYVPGGALNGINDSSIVVIGTTSYKVSSHSEGSAATYDKTGESTTVGSGTPETPGYVVIAKDDTTGGSNLDPALASGTSLAGTIIGERKFLMVSDTARVSSNTDDGTDTFTIDTNTNVGSNAASLSPSPVATFYHVALSINKTVSPTTGKPGDTLEYTVTVKNETSGNAGKVSIEDKIPAYTTLLSWSGSYGGTGGSGAATETFANISDGTNAIDVTLDTTDDESGTVGCGSTESNALTAGKKINFYLGSGANSTTGGTVAAGKTYTIKYRVKIN